MCEEGQSVESEECDGFNETEEVQGLHAVEEARGLQTVQEPAEPATASRPVCTSRVCECGASVRGEEEWATRP